MRFRESHKERDMRQQMDGDRDGAEELEEGLCACERKDKERQTWGEAGIDEVCCIQTTSNPYQCLPLTSRHLSFSLTESSLALSQLEPALSVSVFS